MATWPGKERGGASAWTDQEFYELGRLDWADFFKQWNHYGLKAGTCVEIGCGAGRITNHLRRYFEQVTALDISSHQLDYARERVPAANIALRFLTARVAPSTRMKAAFSVMLRTFR